MDFAAFRESLTPEQMDELEAHWLVKCEHRALVMKHVLTCLLQSRGHELEADEFDYLGKLWLE